MSSTQSSQHETQRHLTSRQMAWYRFSSNPSALIGALIVISVIIGAIFAPVLAPSPQSAGARYTRPTKNKLNNKGVANQRGELQSKNR